MRWINKLEGYTGAIDCDFLISRSSELLRQYQNPDKQAERKRFLDENPHLRIRIATEPLKQIIKYESFKCSPVSSIARDQAVFGSDIDGGIVVAEQPIPTTQQITFLDELRRQGFDAYHKTEVAFVSKKLGYMEDDWWSQDNPGELPTEIACWQYTEGHMLDSIVRFTTRSGLERIINSRRLIDPVMIYLAGYSIK